MQKAGHEIFGLMADFLETQVNYTYYDYIKDPEFISLVESHIERIKQQFDLDGIDVSLITTNVPVVWAKLLSDAGCRVKVVGYHPLLISCKDIIETIDNVTVVEANVFVDDLDPILEKDGLIVYPDFEFYVPLQYVNYDLSDKNVFAVSCFKDPHKNEGIGIIQPNIVNTLDEFKQSLGTESFKFCKQTKYKDLDYFYMLSLREMTVKFITMKWGTKYGPEYVNRLLEGIDRTYTGSYSFYCVTDNTEGLDPRIKILTFEDIGYEQSNCFTIQKMFLFKKGALKFKGPYVVLDLDTVIINDFKPYFDKYKFKEGRFIKNYWEDIEGCRHLAFFGACWLNSSFVTWNGDQLDFIYQFYEDNKDIIEWKYGDLDWFLWCALLDKLNFHPPKTCYAYSFGAHYPDDMEKYIKRDDYLMTIFNTSHGEGIELHEADGWAAELWAGTSSQVQNI